MKIRFVFLAVLLGALTAHGQVFGRWNKNDEGGGAAQHPILLTMSLLPPDSECSGTPPDGVTFARTSIAFCETTSGEYAQVSAGRARVHATKGLLVEGQATNAILYNRLVDRTPWTGCGGGNALGFGGQTVNYCPADSPTSQTVTTSAGPRVFSVFVRPNGACTSSTVTIEVGEESTTETVTDWARLILPYESTGETTVTISGDCEFAADFAQDEEGTWPTSPVRSLATAAVRASETASIEKPSRLSGSLGCMSVSITPTWTGNNPFPSGSTYVDIGGSANRLGYVNPNNSRFQAYSGPGSGIPQVEANYEEGVTRRYRTEWSLALGTYKTRNETDGIDSSAVTFPGYAFSSSVINIGGASTARANAYIRDLVLGRTMESCQ